MLKRFNIKVPTEFEEPLIGLAERFGVNVFSSPVIKETDRGETDYDFTGETTVSFIVSDTEQNPEDIYTHICNWLKETGLKNVKPQVEEYSDNQDWMAGFREHFKTLHVGKNIVIRPPWDHLTAEENNIVELIIDPGMAFGTGTHETTRLCLELLEEIDVAGNYFLDMGAGSGILSFYLMKRGAAAGMAVELEGAAVENMKKNASANGMSDRLKMICSDIQSFEPSIPADGLVANITSPVILDNIAILSKMVKSGAWGVFSGVNSTNAQKVRDAFWQNNWEEVKETREGDWHGFYLIKK
ncbi:MAG: 50S ribosomal protein L11 methyltransferase [Candidatus Rifleibacteriota bacterium]